MQPSLILEQSFNYMRYLFYLDICLEMKYKKFILKDFPNDNFPEDTTCFEFIQNAEIAEQLQEGEALVRVVWVSLDPILRTWISGAKSYLDAVKPGSPIPGFGIGKVVKINNKKEMKNPLKVDDWCVGIFEWSQYIKRDISSLQNLPVNNGQQMYKFLTIYGPTGFTSYLSIKREIFPFKIENPNTKKLKTPSDMNIVISSVAGGVGLTVAEYLSKLGYKRVFGIAGSDQKCKIAKELGCKDCVNYKKFYDRDTIRAKEFENAVQQMLNGEKIDIYYENVGQDMLSSMLNLMANHSKIIMCGATATYNNWGKQKGIQNYENIITKRIQVKGILYFNQSYKQRVSSLMEMLSYEMKGQDIVIKGIEKLSTAYRDMIHGKFIGKPVVQLWNEGQIQFS